VRNKVNGTEECEHRKRERSDENLDPVSDLFESREMKSRGSVRWYPGQERFAV
jgi:hypothetical protein